MLTLLTPPNPHEAAGIIALLAQFDLRTANRSFLSVFNEIHACVMHKQYAIVQMPSTTAAGNKSTPVGYILWGLMNFTSSAIYGKQLRQLSPGEYNSGDQLWIVQFASPFGMKQEIYDCCMSNIPLLRDTKQKLALDLFENVPSNLLKTGEPPNA